MPARSAAFRGSRFLRRSLAPALCDHGVLDAGLVGVGLVGMTVEESHDDLTYVELNFRIIPFPYQRGTNPCGDGMCSQRAATGGSVAGLSGAR
jgi:hypothetical protein